jgi:hypothetical protein
MFDHLFVDGGVAGSDFVERSPKGVASGVVYADAGRAARGHFKTRV